VASIERLSSGIVELDRILGGGLPVRSVSVLSGKPGSGKTILAWQVLFHLARQGKRCLYFTTLSEPTLKMIHYLQLFTFFDQRVLDERIVCADVGSHARAQSPAQVLAAVTARVEREEPDLVVIDSFKALHDLLSNTASRRVFVYDLAVSMAAWGATTLLLGEYTTQELEWAPEFAIADGIIRLDTQPQELATVRVLEVLKLRGANVVSGQHSFEITGAGLAVYPRVHVPAVTGEAPSPIGERLTSGIAGLDDLLRGGVPRRTSTVVQGATGTGKTLLGLTFLVAGAHKGERALFIALEETPAQLRGQATGFGWDLSALEADGRLTVSYISPLELSVDRFLYGARQRVQTAGAQRVVLDSISSVALGVPSQRRLHQFIYALTKHFRLAGVTTLLTLEVPEQFGVVQLTGHGVSAIADNVVRLRFVEVGGRIERAISVLKARGVPHESEPRRCTIGAGGMRVAGAFPGYRGILTGVPESVAQSAPRAGRHKEER
jgi:circadian clock protein KaiC